MTAKNTMPMPRILSAEEIRSSYSLKALYGFAHQYNAWLEAQTEPSPLITEVRVSLGLVLIEIDYLLAKQSARQAKLAQAA